MGRPDPLLPASAYKTYSIVAPLATHHRPATCAEVDCPNYLNGWQVRVEGLPPELLCDARAHGRHREVRVAEGETWLVYEAGQPCFKASEHRTRLDQPELFLVRGGDHRGNPRRTPTRRHTRPEHWVEDFAEHQQGLADVAERG